MKLEAEINEASYTKNINVETKLSRQRINSFSVASRRMMIRDEFLFQQPVNI